MSINENKAIVRKYINEVINTGNIDMISNFISPNYREVYNGKIYPIGIEGAINHIKGVRNTYPDLKLTIDFQIAEGDWVATCITAQGTHKGEWMGIQPTGKLLTYSGVNLNKLEKGRIVEHSGAANMLGPLLEAGAIKIVSRD
jgi:predicted ester cyclase